MTILFAGGEDGDLRAVGNCVVDTATTAARNTTRARCSLKVGPVIANGDGWRFALPSAQSNFWLTAKVYMTANGGGDSPTNEGNYIALTDSSGLVRLRIGPTNTGGSNPMGTSWSWRISKQDAGGTITPLVTAVTPGITLSTQLKIDVLVNYAVAGTVTLYINGVQIITYSGDVTTNSVTSLLGGYLGCQSTISSSNTAYWSELIAATVDTRSMNLVTLPPLAAGNTQAWTGVVGNINETTCDDATMISSATATQVGEFTVLSSGITGNPAIVGVVVNARAAKGSSGPSKADLMVRTGSTDYVSADQTLTTSFGNISNVWETNPNTGVAWLYTDLTAAGFNVGVKSVT